MHQDSKITQHTISGGGLTASFIALGATLCDLRLDGHDAPLVLGLENLAHYPKHSGYLGATVGRVANRIAHASFTLNGVKYSTPPNFLGKHTLHSGEQSADKLYWELVDKASDSLCFKLVLDDGHMGFPGRMVITATFHCKKGGTLQVDYQATCDAPTLCNLAHHSYFNLDDSGDISHHMLSVNAQNYTPVDDECIPTGIAPVAGTAFDFTQKRSPLIPAGLDHNFCLSSMRTPLREVAVLESALSGVQLRIATTEPGLQVYDGAHLSSTFAGIGGRQYRPSAGIAIEPQVWPDAPNQKGFPSAELQPGDVYTQTSCFSFKKA